MKEGMEVFNINDNFGRRSGLDRRKATDIFILAERRAGADRRSEIDRRSGLERRGVGERRNLKRISFGMDRRKAKDRRMVVSV